MHQDQTVVGILACEHVIVHPTRAKKLGLLVGLSLKAILAVSDIYIPWPGSAAAELLVARPIELMNLAPKYDVNRKTASEVFYKANSSVRKHDDPVGYACR